MSELTQVEATRHNAIVSKAWALTNGRLVLLDEELSERPGLYDRWQLRRAIRYFEQALKIHPDGWSSMWALGKFTSGSVTSRQAGSLHYGFKKYGIRSHPLSNTRGDAAAAASSYV